MPELPDITVYVEALRPRVVGQILRDVRIFDQDGNPISLGSRCGTYPDPLDPNASVFPYDGNLYPRCPQDDPFAIPGISRSPSPAEQSSPEQSPSDEPSAMPSAAPQPSATPSPSAVPSTTPAPSAPTPTR